MIVKNFRGTSRKPITFGDAYNITPVYMIKDPWDPR